MDPTEERRQSLPSQGEGTESGCTDRELAEGLASMRWQLRDESGRFTRRDTERRTPIPTPHRVGAMPSAVAGQRGDSDDEEEGGDVSGAARRTRRTSMVTREERPDQPIPTNQQMGAPPGSGVPLDGPMLTIPISTTPTTRQNPSSSTAEQHR